MRKTIFKGRVFNVVEEVYKKGGKNLIFQTIEKSNAVVILPILGDKIILEKQYRISLGMYIYEVPAGGIEKGENPKSAAIRELTEETGYFTKKMEKLFSAYTSPGNNTEFMHYYLATGLVKKKAHRDPGEIITVVPTPIEKLLGMIKSGKIRDMKSIAIITYYLKVKEKHPR